MELKQPEWYWPARIELLEITEAEKPETFGLRPAARVRLAVRALSSYGGVRTKNTGLDEAILFASNGSIEDCMLAGMMTPGSLVLYSLKVDHINGPENVVTLILSVAVNEVKNSTR